MLSSSLGDGRSYVGPGSFREAELEIVLRCPLERTGLVVPLFAADWKGFSEGVRLSENQATHNLRCLRTDPFERSYNRDSW